MSHQDWFRNTEWNESIERAFEEKLRRARQKSQYLRIQASTLAESHPTVALRLLERYLALDDKFDRAQAYCDQATAFRELGRIDDAVSAYEKALHREAECPNLKTQAYVELPFLIATRRLLERFDQAEQILRDYQSRLTFPVDRFMWHSAMALIAESRGDGASASEHAARALIEANQRHSGLQFHPAIGLVTQRHQRLIDQLTPMSGKPVH
jgi:tetratricopeptide (TPR) repeat protein